MKDLPQPTLTQIFFCFIKAHDMPMRLRGSEYVCHTVVKDMCKKKFKKGLFLDLIFIN